MPHSDRIYVVGAGPVGAVMTLALARRGIPVTLLEAEPGPVDDQRAATVHPPTIEMLEELGIEKDGWETGLQSPLFHFWDRVTGERIAEFDLGVLKDEIRYPFCLQWEQYKLARSALAHLPTDGSAEVRFSHRLIGLVQTDDAVTLTAEVDGETVELTGSHVIGTDGGRSTVRKLAGIDFEGFTWGERFLKIGTTFDFLSTSAGFCTRNYFSDPDEWLNLFKVKGPGEPGIWRGIFPVPADEPDEVATSDEGIQRRMQKFFPRDGRYDIAYQGLYKVHQRVASTFNRGRVLLAGDSAHVNNPIGGMGMNGGIHDAINLADKLADIRFRGASPEVLNRYTRQRRTAQTDFVQAQTIRNKHSLEEKDPVKRRHNLDELRRTCDDLALHKAFLYRGALFDSLKTANAIQ
ncbi:MAG: FAD-dependent monooxygenase [Proteobacteria bacterium]|nr:FAD-dependent monooxygenase [Burkholderiales bacterium]